MNELKFSMKDVEANEKRIPDSPGIYAWYSFFRYEEFDLYEENPAKGVMALREFLDDISKKFTSEKIAVDIKNTFNRSWGGLVKKKDDRDFSEKYINNRIKLSSLSEMNTEEPEAKEVDFEPILNDFEARKIIASYFNNFNPIFNSPLYIGMSRNLRKRIIQHNHIFYDAYAKRESISFENIKNSFAKRAVEVGFKADNLLVYLYPFENMKKGEERLGKTELAAIISLLEKLSNQCNLPFLGRE